jgi:NNP family nitrate/nitrite transporter-like MFS transporter
LPGRGHSSEIGPTQLRGFFQVGDARTLLCAFLYFDVSFMVWVLLGALANSIVSDFGLNETQRGLMLAVPLLGGSILRIVLGLSTDRMGARRTGILGLALTLVPLLVGWLWAQSYVVLLVVGLMLGVAGASFAAALPLASRWYPPQYQGIAMGIAGAGNSGTVFATLFGPILAAAVGWQQVFALALIPVLLTLVLFVLFARESPSQPPAKQWRDYALVLAMPDTWWFCFFYSVTFGGFVGLAVFLNSFFKVQYDLSPVEAGYFASACVLSGSLLRPVGGYLADRFGGVRLLTMLYFGVAVTMLAAGTLPPLWIGATLLFLGMGMLGMGNGSVFQLVPQRFPNEIGVVTGLVGAAGGIGGFFLPNLLGSIKQVAGTFSYAFVIFALVAGLSAAALVYASRSWEGVFLGRGGLAPATEAPA